MDERENSVVMVTGLVLMALIIDVTKVPSILSHVPHIEYFRLLGNHR